MKYTNINHYVNFEQYRELNNQFRGKCWFIMMKFELDDTMDENDRLFIENLESNTQKWDTLRSGN